MQRDIILTSDGSHSMSIPALNVTYHSIHGAVQESRHVFIEAGLKNIAPAAHPVRILEMGFGTGLNALLTLIEAERIQQPVQYTTLELYPLEPGHTRLLNYCEQLQRPDLQRDFEQLHSCEWESEMTVTPCFTFLKSQSNLLTFNPSNHTSFHLIYFDAFAPGAQPELWTRDVFEKLYNLLLPGGILVTYCSKSDVRRAMQAAGFIIEKIPGPPGKREMLRAARPIH